ncbi:MAG: hypothetical protein H7836_18165, partial [Magnetococcus sp. YQC-3]
VLITNETTGAGKFQHYNPTTDTWDDDEAYVIGDRVININTTTSPHQDIWRCGNDGTGKLVWSSVGDPALTLMDNTLVCTVADRFDT